MAVQSYGILLYRKVWGRKHRKITEVFLIKPDGPHFRSKNLDDLWGFPKGKQEKGESPLESAKREFFEEVGCEAPNLFYQKLKPLRTYQGKVITIYAADASGISVTWDGSKVFHAEYEDEHGVYSYPETRDGRWLPIEEALVKIGRGQKIILEDFVRRFKVSI